MEEQNSIYLQRLCAAVKQVQIEASQTNEFLVRDGRSPLQLCGRYEDIFSHRYRYSALSLLKKKPGFWGVLRDISRKEALTRIKNLHHPETDLGRCRAWIRLAANENSLVAYILALQSNPELLTKYYEPQAFLRDPDLTEATTNVLSGLESLRFELTLDTASLEIEIAPDAYVPADKISRLMAIELARAIQQPSEPVQIERRPHRKKRRQPKQSSHSHSTDTDSPECPDSESDYGSLMKPVLTSPLIVNQAGHRKHNPGLSSSFENHPSLSDSGLGRGFGLSSSAPAPHAIVLKTPTFISDKETPPSSSVLEQIVEKSIEIPEFLSPIVELEPTYEHEKEIVETKNESPVIEIREEIKPNSPTQILPSPNSEQTMISQFRMESNSQDENEEKLTKEMGEFKLDLSPEITETVPVLDQFSEQKSLKPFLSLEFQPKIEPRMEHKKSFESIEDFPTAEIIFKSPVNFSSPMIFNSSASLPSQTLLTADPIINDRISTPPVNTSDSDEFYSINGEWDVIQSEEMVSLDEVSIENLDTNPLVIEKLCDDYFMQEINVDKLSTNEVYSTMKKIVEELKGVDSDHPSYKILVHTLVKLRIRRLEIQEGTVQTRGKRKRKLKIFGHNLEIISSKNQMKSCDICGKNFTHINFKKKWAECQECGLVLHAQCIKKIPSICPAQGTPKYILTVTHERGLLVQKFKCKNCSCPIGLGAKDEAFLCRYTGYYFCPDCYSIKPSILPAKIVHDWDFDMRGVSLNSYLSLKIIYSQPRIDLSQENPLIYSYVNTLAECSTVREALKQMFVFLNVCNDAKETGLLNVHQGILHDHIWKGKEPWSIEDLCLVKDGRFLPALKTFFTKWNAHIRHCPRCSGNGFFCIVCHSEDIIFPWDILASFCPHCGVLLHSNCMGLESCPRCSMRARRMDSVV